MMILHTLLLAGLLFLLGTDAGANMDQQSPASDEESWYQIDVLIIKRLDRATRSAERWPPVTEHHFPLDAVKLYSVEQQTVSKEILSASTPVINQRYGDAYPEDEATYAASARYHLSDRKPDIATQAFVLLPARLGRLNGEAESIRRSRDYHLLYQASWRMPLQPDSQPTHIYIEAGQKIGNDSQLEGVITLSARRFIHASPQLWLNRLNPVLSIGRLLLTNQLLTPLTTSQPFPAMPPISGLASPVDIHYTGNFLMAESRRLKHDAINYFDSPSLAILLSVTPYQRPKQAEIPESKHLEIPPRASTQNTTGSKYPKYQKAGAPAYGRIEQPDGQ